MENIKIVLKGNIKAQRKRLGINQEQLAERSGLSTAYIKNIERGVSWPSPESMEALSRGLECSIDRLFSEPGAIANILPVKASAAIRMFASIPDDVYLLAQKITPDDQDAWDAVRVVLEDAIEANREKGQGKQA